MRAAICAFIEQHRLSGPLLFLCNAYVQHFLHEFSSTTSEDELSL